MPSSTAELSRNKLSNILAGRADCPSHHTSTEDCTSAPDDNTPEEVHSTSELEYTRDDSKAEAAHTREAA